MSRLVRAAASAESCCARMQRHLRSHLRPIGGEEREQRVAARIAARRAIAATSAAARSGRPASCSSMTRNARSAATSMRRSPSSNSTQSTTSTSRSSSTCSSRRSPCPSRMRPAAARRSSSSQTLARNAVADRSARATRGAPRFPQQAGSVAKLSSSARLTASAPSGRRHRRSLGVEAREPRADRGQLRGPGGAGRDARGERRVLGVAPHLDRVVDGVGVVLRAEPQTAVRVPGPATARRDRRRGRAGG